MAVMKQPRLASALPLQPPPQQPQPQQQHRLLSTKRSAFFEQQQTPPPPPPVQVAATESAAQSATQALHFLRKDLRELKLNNHNPQMRIAHEDARELLVEFRDRGRFRVLVVDKATLSMETPSSNGLVRTYVADKEQYGRWVCTTDGHDLHGLFLRDLIPLVSGLPAWATR